MILQTITANDKFYTQAYALYRASFPYLERRDKDGHNWVMAKKDYNFGVILDGNEFWGIMLYFETEQFVYLEHFAVLENKRGNGIGSTALNLLKQKGKTVILEIEEPIDDLTIRRLNFYKRNGFILTNHYHIQAKYHKGDKDLPLKILSYPTAISKSEYISFNDYLKSEVSL